jgi:hypothetical protein
MTTVKRILQHSINANLDAFDNLNSLRTQPEVFKQSNSPSEWVLLQDNNGEVWLILGKSSVSLDLTNCETHSDVDSECSDLSNYVSNIEEMKAELISFYEPDVVV